MDGLLPENHDFWGIDAAPLHPLLDHRHSHPCRDEACLVQLSTLGHPALGRFNDDAGRLFSLHHSMHQSWSARIFDSLKKLISWAIADWNTCRERAFLKFACVLLPALMHYFVDMLQAKAWIIYMTSCFSCIVMYIWTWTCQKISFFYPVNLNKSSCSSGMEDRQEHQS